MMNQANTVSQSNGTPSGDAVDDSKPMDVENGATIVKSKDDHRDRPLTPPLPNMPKELKCTPALMKVRKTMKEFQVNSPSDSIMSPCTAKLTRKSSKILAESQEAVPQKLSFDE